MNEPNLAGGVSRRDVLAGVGGVAVVTVAGCGGSGGVGDPDDDGRKTEIIVGNGTDEPAMIAVLVKNDTGETLFDRVYELGPEMADGSAAIETVPATVAVFTHHGNAARWELPAPDPGDGCTEDLGIRLLPDGSFEQSYSC